MSARSAAGEGHGVPEPRIEIVVDGTPVTVIKGQSIAAALLAADRLSWRTTAHQCRPRGLFCGIGVCFDCLVTVNGVPDVRACQRRVAEDDVVDLQGRPPAVPSQEIAASEDGPAESGPAESGPAECGQGRDTPGGGAGCRG